jgi:uncharacterized membrane protein (DUF4010 family)
MGVSPAKGRHVMGGFSLSTWFNVNGTPFETLPVFGISLCIGLLVGIERERKHHVLAGIRTFPLTALLGTLCAMLGHLSGAVEMPLAGFAAITAFGFLPGAHGGIDDTSDPHTTTIVSLLVVYCLGILVYYSYAPLAVAAGVIVTSLLYLKPELTGITQKLDRRDLYSLLQFGALTFIILPLLPNRAFGPYQAFNPHHVWLMVVLIVGLGLVGYLSVRLFGERVGGPFLGLLGGLVSSTVTSLIYSRQARDNPDSAQLAGSVIQLANLVLNVRMMIFAAALAPDLLPQIAVVMAPGLVIGLIVTFARYHKSKPDTPRPPMALSNPADLKLAFSFAAIFAAVLVCSAWLNAKYGSTGVYTMAIISGANEVDAIVLTVLNLFNQHRFEMISSATAIAMAVGSNLLFKFGLIYSLGGRSLAIRCLPTFAAILGGLILGVAVLQLHLI